MISKTKHWQRKPFGVRLNAMPLADNTRGTANGNEIEANMMSACGVLCSECPAYLGTAKGIEHQKRTVEAWYRIYGLTETVEHISCCGCLGPEEEVFYASRNCSARRCCRSKGFSSCAECLEENCADLKKAQSVWDEVPNLIKKLSSSDFATYAQPYCHHRKRLSAARAAFHNRP